MKHFFKCHICGCKAWAADRTPVDLQILRSEVCTDCLKIVHGIEYIFDENEDLVITPIPASIPEPDDAIYEQLDIDGALNALVLSSEDVASDDEDDAKYLAAVLNTLLPDGVLYRLVVELLNPDAHLNLDAALTRAYYAGVVAALNHINHKED